MKNRVTQEKLSLICDALKSDLKMKEWEIPNLSNFVSLIYKKSKSIGKPVSHQTIYNHSNFIKSQFKKEVVEEKCNKTPLAVVMVWSDGTKEVLWGELPNKKKVQPEAVQIPKIWLGLFDYKDDGRIIIRKDRRYIGCDITSNDDLIKYFGTVSSYLKWCRWAYDAPNRPNFNRNIDTDKDVETLKGIISDLENKINKIEF